MVSEWVETEVERAMTPSGEVMELQLMEYLQRLEAKFDAKLATLETKMEGTLMVIRENGYAIDDEELSVGLRCVGAPLFDHNGQARYAISLSGPSIRMGSKRIEEMQRALKKICKNLSGKMGDYYF